ncbi:EamA-like transporter family protein [Pseudomonas flavescens]|uniref:EamA-like transporter family protein n=1 Tax=Phytopseudomonas flavescens TaxID=29435 RepID=A0A1G8C9D2_9GAMM|nr:DMT family transporter [Pseudomonas flavescens]SDH42101.1 EamA-like transporter family protein [Pseudomonas flavescens]
MRPADMLRLLLLAAIWGASFLFLRVVAPVIGSMPTAFFRAAIAVLGLLGILLLMRVKWDFRGKLGLCLLLGVINAGLPSAMYSLAALVLPAGYSAIINATTPMMGVLIGALLFAEALTATRAAGVALGLFGVAVLTRSGPVEVDIQLLLGAVACLVATACYGLAGFLTRRWIAGGLDNRLTAFGSLCGASLFLLPLFGGSLAIQPPPSWGGWLEWSSLLALGLGCTAFAYVLYFRLLNDIGPIRASTTTFLIPIFGVLWGALLLDEPLSWAHLYGGVLIAIALWLVVRPAKKMTV